MIVVQVEGPPCETGGGGEDESEGFVEQGGADEEAEGEGKWPGEFLALR